MAAEIAIGQLNVMVTFETYLFGQSAAGGVTKTLYSSYDDWINIRQLSHSRILEQAGIEFREAYEILKHHYVSRPVNKDADEIIFESVRLSIAGIEIIKSNKKDFDRITAYTTGIPSTQQTGIEIICNWMEIEW
jgi:head-tail adaptor